MTRVESLEVPKKNEITANPVVGWKLQDVLLAADTDEPAILSIRKRIEASGLLENDRDTRAVVLDAVCMEMFGVGLEQIKEVARQILVPFKGKIEGRKTLIVSSATSASASQEAELGILEKRGRRVDIPGAIEGRDTRSAKKGDVALISTKSGLVMAENEKEIEIINLAEEKVLSCRTEFLYGSDLYYKADGLLLLIITNSQSEVLHRLMEVLVEDPVVYPYNLDEETQMFLVYLAKEMGIERVMVNANSSEVAIELTRKGFRYPTVEEALEVSYSDNPYVMQVAEWECSQAAREVGHHTDCVPGYVVERGESFGDFKNKALLAMMLLSTRYDFEDIWIKPDRGTDGGNQWKVDLGRLDNLNRDVILEAINNNQVDKALKTYEECLRGGGNIYSDVDKMWEKEGDWVLEAVTHYFETDMLLKDVDCVLCTNPSVHVINGKVRDTVSLQFVDGTAWGGNLICSKKMWGSLVEMIADTDERVKSNPELKKQLLASYDLMPESMRDYVGAINASERYEDGQVRGGADLAVATLGGKFNHERIEIVVQDFNARANGSETVYALYDLAKKILGSDGEAVTRNLDPLTDFTSILSALPGAVEQLKTIYGRNVVLEQVKLVAVSAGWGQLSVIGKGAMEIMGDVLLIEKILREMNLIA